MQTVNNHLINIIKRPSNYQIILAFESFLHFKRYDLINILVLEEREREKKVVDDANLYIVYNVTRGVI